jgi:hypothetical protein
MFTAARVNAMLVALALVAQAAQTPAQIAGQIDALWQQLKALIAGPAPVTTAAQLTAALQQGGTITLAPGTYPGNFVVSKNGTSVMGPVTAVLVPTDPLSPTLTWGSVDDVTIEGLMIQAATPPAGTDYRDAVVVGDYRATSLAAFPHRPTFRNVSIVTPAGKGHRGLALHAIDAVVINPTITGFCEPNRDSQALWLNGPGPYTVTGGVYEASGENILVGGADVALSGMNPTNVTVTGVTLRKPASYKADGCTVKNAFELKAGVHVTFSGLIDGWWPSGQAAPIQITARNQDGTAPWTTVDDVHLTGIVVRNASGGGFAVNVQSTDNEHPSGTLKTLAVDHTLFQDTAGGFQIIGPVAGGVTIDHVTLPAVSSKLFSFDDLPNVPRQPYSLTFTNNVATAGAYAVTGHGDTTFGLPTLQAYTTLTAWSGNVIESAGSWKWPAGQAIVSAGGLAALIDPTTFKLLSGSAGY